MRHGWVGIYPPGDDGTKPLRERVRSGRLPMRYVSSEAVAPPKSAETWHTGGPSWESKEVVLILEWPLSPIEL